MHTPSLTVLMTVYNGMPYLMEAVRSVLTQDYSDFTFLILNNGSTDGGPAWLEECARKHGRAMPRLIVEHLPRNVGRSAVLAKGLALADTDFIAILDADDVAAPNRLSRQMDFLKAHPDIDLLGSDVLWIDGNGRRVGGDRFAPDHDGLRDRLPLFNQFAHSAVMYRARAAREAGGYDAAFPYAQDLSLWVAMFKNGARAASIPEPLVSLRRHPGQVTRNLALIMVRTADDQRLAEAMLAIPGLSAASRQTALLRSAHALFRLGRKKEALARAWRAFAEAPLRFITNPLLLERLTIEIKRRLRRWTR